MALFCLVNPKACINFGLFTQTVIMPESYNSVQGNKMIKKLKCSLCEVKIPWCLINPVLQWITQSIWHGSSNDFTVLCWTNGSVFLRNESLHSILVMCQMKNRYWDQNFKGFLCWFDSICNCRYRMTWIQIHVYQ